MKDGDAPAAAVLHFFAEPEKVVPPALPGQLILEDQGRYLLVVKGTHWYGVYAESQTEPVPESVEESEPQTGPESEVSGASLQLTQSSISSSSKEPPPTPSSIKMRLASEALENKGLTESRSTSRHGKVNSVRSYVPEGLELTQPQQPYRDSIYQFLGLIYRKHLEMALDMDAYVPLYAAYLRDNIPAFQKLWPLVEGSLVERDGFYVKGEKSYGYRLAEPFRGQTHRLTELANADILRKSVKDRLRSLKHPVHRFLSEQLPRLSIVGDDYRRRFATHVNYDHYDRVVRTIEDGDWEFRVDDFAGRVHTPVTRLYKPLRSLLRADGDRLGEVDVRNSQPNFLALRLKESGVDCGHYLRLVQEGILYDTLADRLGIMREDAKEELLRVFYSKNGYSSPLKRCLGEMCPRVLAAIQHFKAKDHRRLAQLMQRAEAKFMIGGVCERIRHQRPDIFIATIHDSILCNLSECGYVEEVIGGMFKEKGITATLRVTQFDSKYENDYDARREGQLRIHHGGEHGS